MRILITGVAGLVGSILAKELSINHEVTGIDLRQSELVETAVVDLADAAAIAPSFAGIDAVIHLAAERRHEREIGWDILTPRNIVPTANVYQAAHEAGVSRFVFTSSMHVMGMYEEDEPWRSIVGGDYAGLDPATVPLISGSMPPRPDGRYAVSKEFGESLGRYYADCEGMEVVCVRFGTTSPDSKPGADPRSFVSWFSHRDISGFFRACVERPGIGYEIVYGTSANTWKAYDTAYAWEVLGFTPKDNAEDYREAR